MAKPQLTRFSMSIVVALGAQCIRPPAPPHAIELPSLAAPFRPFLAPCQPNSEENERPTFRPGVCR